MQQFNKEGHNTRYVEYIDVFSRHNLTPTASIRETLLLFDTFNGTDPLSPLYDRDADKMYQKICIYVIKGQCTISINSKAETVGSSQLITIMPENTTNFISKTEDLNYFAFVLYPKMSNQIYSEIGITYSNTRMSLCHFVSSLTSEQMHNALELYTDIKSEILGPEYDQKQSYIRNLLSAVIIKNINIHNYTPMLLMGDSNSRQYDIYCRFLALLNKHSIEHRSVQFYADALDISSKYLSFVCISYSGKNASTWIDESVTQKAKALLVVHHYSFSEASIALHFPTVSSFSRFFKRVTGTTPREFLKKESKF